MTPAPFPWWVAGGHALDLAVGRPIRARKDVDLAILRRDQAALRTHLVEWEVAAVRPGHGLSPWSAGAWLEPPIHELWARPRAAVTWRFEVLLNEADDARWLYRRDPRISLPLAAVLNSRVGGVPVLPPEVVLLYKAKAPRPEDEIDFQAARETLSKAARAWLRAALTMAHPGHRWLPDLV